MNCNEREDKNTAWTVVVLVEKCITPNEFLVYILEYINTFCVLVCIFLASHWKKKLLSFVSWSSVASLIKSHSNDDSFCLSPTQVTKQMRDFKIFNALSSASSSSSYQHQEHLRVGSKTFTTSSFWYCFWKSFFSLSFFSMLVTF